MHFSLSAFSVRRLAGVSVLCTAFAVGGCAKPRKPRPQPASINPAAEAQVHPVLPPGSPISGSLHDLGSVWRDQNAQELTLTDLPGRVRVMAMGYTSCRFACPRLIADMRRIEQTLDEAGSTEGVRFFFVSIDPERDTPDRLKASMKENALSEGRWSFLTGDADSVLELAVVLGMKYQRSTPGDFAHSNIITVVGPDGAILHQQVGMGSDSGVLIEAIRQTLEARSGTGYRSESPGN